VDTNDPLLLPHTGENYITFPLDGASNGLSVASSASLDLTGDIEMVFRYTKTSWNNYDGFGAKNLSYGLRADNSTVGVPQFFFTNASGVQTASPGVTALLQGWLKVTFDADNGSGANTTTFYTAPDQASEPTSWTLLGSPAVGTGTSAIVTEPAQALTVGQVFGNGFNGGIYRAIIRNGIGGTTVLDVDCPTDVSSSEAASFTATTGQTVTVNRATSGRKTVIVTRPIWLFGTDDYLEIADTALLDVAAGESFTVGVVGRAWSTFGTNDAFVAKKANTTNTTAGWALTAQSATAPQAAFDVGDGINGAESVSGSRTAGVLFLVAGVRNVTADTLTTYLNTMAGTPVTDTTTGSSANAEVVRIGALSGTASEFSDFEMLAAFAARRAWTAAELSTVAAFYGVA
jgi:hypothetical protein